MDDHTLFSVPAKFYDDHAERDLDTPRTVRRAGARVWVKAYDPALRELLSDADFYADPWGPDELPAGLKDSAKRTVAAIKKARPNLVP